MCMGLHCECKTVCKSLLNTVVKLKAPKGNQRIGSEGKKKKVFQKGFHQR